MSKKKARKPDGAKNGPAASNTKLVKVKFVYSKELAELILAVPKKATEDDLVQILNEIESRYSFDDLYGRGDIDDSISLVDCETIEDGKAKANFVVARAAEETWKVVKAAAQ